MPFQKTRPVSFKAFISTSQSLICPFNLKPCFECELVRTVSYIVSFFSLLTKSNRANLILVLLNGSRWPLSRVAFKSAVAWTTNGVCEVWVVGTQSFIGCLMGATLSNLFPTLLIPFVCFFFLLMFCRRRIRWLCGGAGQMYNLNMRVCLCTPHPHPPRSDTVCCWLAPKHKNTVSSEREKHSPAGTGWQPPGLTDAQVVQETLEPCPAWHGRDRLGT